MEDGQKININLESPLDTKSSDMIVSVNDVKFAHNRQKYQGHVLPTSLRYERNGWAAGWYVYDFKMGGGYIFSRNQAESILVPYLAATRSKLNSTPTYVITFKIAKNNDLSDPEAVASATQYQAWYTVSPSINARECAEASIDNGIQPVLTFNYAVEEHDYRRKIQFNFDVCSTEEPMFTVLNDAYGDADLSMTYEGHAADGTVTATLYNNEIRWVYEPELYIPKDLIDNDGYKFGKFVDVTNEVINWKLGSETLQYNDAQNKFIYDGVNKNPGDNLTIHYTIPLKYTVPLHKYYGWLNNIAWTIQGTRSLFNNESDSLPTNRYTISVDHISSNSISVSNGALTSTGIDGPDVSVISEAAFDLSDMSELQNVGIRLNTSRLHSIYTVAGLNIKYVPVATLTSSAFKLPGDDENRDVTIQVYYKCTDANKYVGDLGGRRCYANVIDYPFASMSNQYIIHEPLYTDRSQVDQSPTYTVDGKHTGVNGPASISNTVPGLSDDTYIAARDIIGYAFEFNANIKGINDMVYSGDEHVEMKVTGVTSNLVFTRATQTDAWQTISEYGYAGTQPEVTAAELKKLVPLRIIYANSGDGGIAHDTGFSGSYTSQYQQAGDDVTVPSFSLSSGPLYLGVKGTRGNYSLAVYNNDGTEIFSNFNIVWYAGTPVAYINNVGQINSSIIGRIDDDFGACRILDVFKIPGSDKYHLLLKRDPPSEIINAGAVYNNCYTVCPVSKLGSKCVVSEDTDVYKGSIAIYIYESTNGYPSTVKVFGNVGAHNVFARTSSSNAIVKYVSSIPNLPVRDSDEVRDITAAFLLDNTIYTYIYDNSIDVKPVVTFGSTEVVYAFNWLTGDSSDTTYPYDVGSTYQVNEAPETFTAVNDVLRVQTGYHEYTFDYSLEPDYWVGVYNEGYLPADRTLNITTELSNSFCFDIVDNTTGELLVDHNTDSIVFDDDVSLKFIFDAAHIAKGKLFFDSTLSAQEANNAYIAGRNVFNTYNDAQKSLHIYANKSQAFFPVLKYGDPTASIYTFANRSGAQGVAVFRYDGKYIMSILSPLSNYALPPKIKNDKLYVYAKRTFTHHVKFNAGVGQSVYNATLLDDNMTDISNLAVTTRDMSQLFNSASIESDNKYYVNKTVIAPASITYYNSQIHITYKPVSGSSIVIDGSTYDLGTSDISIKQEADLVTLHLPEYDATSKYTFAIGNTDDVLVVGETKNIIDSIADTTKHYATATVNQLNVTNSGYTATVVFNEVHENNSQNVSKSITYTDVLNINNTSVTEYSDDNQLVIAADIQGNANILLPLMPEHKFVYPVSDNKITVTVNTNGFTYDYASNEIVSMHIKGKEIAKTSVKLLSTDSSNQAYNIYRLDINQSINTTVYFKHFGIYKIVGTKAGNLTPHVTQLDYDTHTQIFSFHVADIAVVDGMSVVAAAGTYNFNFRDFEDKELCTPKYLVYSATDVRNPDPATQTKEFARVMAENEYQLIKQHWDSTVATECFWWIDPTHTLELTKDRFILKEKDLSGGYDDWMGDKWNTVYELNRTEYLDSESDTFIVSSANGKNARGYLYILEAVTEDTINVTIYDPLVLTDNRMTEVTSVGITFKHVSLGNKKNTVALNAGNEVSNDHITVCTYSDIVATSLLADSKLSAVCINGTLWLGIQYDKNFNQWSFALNGSIDVVHGYGVIGVNGFATGGMLPAKYFDGHGFTDTVYDISELEAEKSETLKNLDKFNVFNERIVGDENQQWYISDELSDIVMAVDLANCKSITLPITNKYAQIYASPSYAKYTVHALGIQIKQLMDMIIGGTDNPIWMDIIKYAMFPIVWFLSPYTNVINYLQQTLGQYAYTHYNSTSISRKSSKLHDEVNTENAGLSEDEAGSHIDALITDDLSFDVQHISQEQSFKDNSWDNILGIFASMVVSATDMSMRDIAVNQLQNQSAVNDIGKKFSQAFLQNIGSMSVTGFTMQSTKPMLKSEVTAVKTLDMFYSTSAEQNCFAGPGFVNMQFVAQCTAQSVTSVQLEAQQTQIFMLLKELTTWQGKVVIYMLDSLKDLMFKMSDNMSGGPSAGMVVGLGYIGALVMSGLGYALVAAKALVKLGIEVVDSMLDSFFPSGVKTTVTAQLSRHNYDIEGKHAYGNKSEQFFWPCADCKSKLYTDESVEAVLQDKPWPLEMPTATSGNQQTKSIYQDQPGCVTMTPAIMDVANWNGEVPYSIAMCKGSQKRRALPDSTAYVIGTESFMPTTPFKNENIGEGEPVFTPPAVQDYIIDKNWNIFVTAMTGDALWVSCKDTKLFDGNYSNIVVTDDFCGIAAPHIAVEIKRDICEEYLRPWAVSPDAIALNVTGLNCAYDEVAYHAFDGYGYRITDWLGASGMNKERYTWQYCFQVNDRFKRSNKLPPNQFMGNFQALPSMSLDIKDKVFSEATTITEERGLRTGIAGENKDTQRYALPIFTEQISSLPAIVRALSPYKLAVIDGITSLTTDVRISQSVYKIPDSVDFNINDKLYRMTNEYICSVEHNKGLEVVKYLVPALGLTYLGATPFMAFFYNQATRQYYIYQGGNTLQVMDMLERFRDIKGGIYDFINQEVVMPCLATFDRLDSNVKDDTDETDNIIIPVFRHNKVGGELTPPIDTIFNTRSWYRTISIPAGLVFQGPNRCIINRFIWSQYMLNDIKANKGKWKKVPREDYHPFRTYAEKYEDVLLRLDSKVKGWTHNPFLLVTSPIGVNEQTDCKFEWEITFAWTTEMEQIFEHNEYVTVNVMAETMCPGGKKVSRPTHIFLTKELFTRTEGVGYYSFRYQSNNGAGNRERLHIWSDGYIAISSLQLEYKVITEKRNDVLTIQEDVKGMKEM